MKDSMFCYQCEQTAGCISCSGSSGVCGKSADIAGLQDQLIGCLVGLARASEGKEPTKTTIRLSIDGLFATLTNVNFDATSIRHLITEVQQEKTAVVPGCALCSKPCGKTTNYEMNSLWTAQEEIRSLKSLLLFALKGIAAYAYHAQVLGYTDASVNKFIIKGLFVIGEEWTMEYLLPVILEAGEINYKCLELLDRANTETYGVPVPSTLSMTVEKGPFIIISGHDLHDLHLLLEQTAGKGIGIYTHGEMLPAHAYPKLSQYPHLKGHYGTAWQNQQNEFPDVPAPILFTTNCLMPVKESYADRVFTTGVVAYPEMQHIGKDKDFTAVIERAAQLGGYAKDTAFTGSNGGRQLTTGYGHETILSVADQVISAVKDGSIRHFFLVGGCDGAKSGRSYYTDFVKQTPKDSVILTLGCGKYRFNDLDLGSINSLPRIMDMGQCNDAFGAVKVALALADAFGCSVNELPLTIVLSWYEQKAVSILLTLLHLGIKNIFIGPSLPAFLSPKILNYFVENYNISPISTPEKDLIKMLK